jgi:hypothetical protein
MTSTSTLTAFLREVADWYVDQWIKSGFARADMTMEILERIARRHAKDEPEVNFLLEYAMSPKGKLRMKAMMRARMVKVKR